MTCLYITALSTTVNCHLSLYRYGYCSKALDIIFWLVFRCEDMHQNWCPFPPFVGLATRETLESVSSCTRFSGFLTISSFGFDCLSSKLVSMFFGIVPMFVPKDFVSDCFVAQICANYGAHAHFGANPRDEAILNKIL